MRKTTFSAICLFCILGQALQAQLPYIPGAREAISKCFLPFAENFTLNLQAVGGPVNIVSMEVHELESVYETGFDEQYRPQFHYSAPQNWLNDPNGLVYYDGEYHLFHQYNPDGRFWDNMHWYHAVSTDLIHWDTLGIALSMEKHGGGHHIFSGSAVVDWNNTSGFRTGDEQVLVAIYTVHGYGEDWETQNIAYSNDRGRTWTAYEGNPVLPDIEDAAQRDPKVMWYEPDQKWIMSIFEGGHIAFYGSPDLKEWTFLSTTKESFFECPDLFELPIDGDTSITAWVIHDAGNQPYSIGWFNGTEFISEGTKLPEGILFEDFEGAGYGDWEITGNAFGDKPAEGTLSHQQVVSGFLGNQLVNTYLHEDGSMGTALSPEFTIGYRYINFLMGGGRHPGEACMELVIGGNTIFSSTGEDNEMLEWVAWDVSNYQGSKARIRIIDNKQGDWGHINVDHILFSDTLVHGRSKDKCDIGPNYYAAQSFSDIPASDGRRIQIGWMADGEYPEMPFNQQMSIPRELTLRTFKEGVRLCKRPVREIEDLRQESHTWYDLVLQPGENPLEEISGELFDMELEFDPGEAEELIISLRGYQIRYKNSTGRLLFAGKNIPILPDSGKISLRILLDRASIEVFADGLAGDALGGNVLIEPLPVNIQEIVLNQNFPNPFASDTWIEFSLPKRVHVILELFSVSGTLESTLVDQRMGPGTFREMLDGSGLPDGAYYYRISAGEFKETRKCLLINKP
jgi:fructan beta-fructosidase